MGSQLIINGIVNSGCKLVQIRLGKHLGYNTVGIQNLSLFSIIILYYIAILRILSSRHKNGKETALVYFLHGVEPLIGMYQHPCLHYSGQKSLNQNSSCHSVRSQNLVRLILFRINHSFNPGPIQYIIQLIIHAFLLLSCA